MRSTVTQALQAGEAVRHDGVCVLPLFPRRSPVADYVVLDEAAPLGVTITEVDEDGEVGRLHVVNPGPRRVLLYDGQEVVGAKQNRILDVTVLVEAGAKLGVPVSCVEEGRWHRVGPAFAPAGHTGHPELRRRKAERLSARGAASPPGAAQAEVWAAVAEKSSRLGAASPTGALADAVEGRAPDLDRLARRFPLQPGQHGAVLGLAGVPVCLDVVSRPDAFARLYPAILRGYLMDAVEHLGGAETSDAALERFIDAVGAAGARRGPAVGLGEDLRLTGGGVVGSGLALDGEVIQLSAYAGATAGPGAVR